MKKRLSLLLVAVLLPALAACGQSGLPTAPTLTAVQPTSTQAQATDTARPRRTPTAEEAPERTPTQEDEAQVPVSPATPTLPEEEDAAPTDPLAIELQATVVAGLPAAPTPRAGDPGAGGFEGVEVFHIDTADGFGTLWAAYSYGARSFDPPAQHFVAVYTQAEAGWLELDRVELEDPDYLDRLGVQQVAVDLESTWLQVESGVGAHAGCFDLLRFDGQKLRNEVSHCGSAPGPGTLTDLNGDGIEEVLLDATDHYVFCYACNVDYINTQVKRWDGSAMLDVGLEPLPDTAPEELRQLTNQAIELARHDLWKDAQALINDTQRFNSQDETYIWDAALINLDASKRANHVQYSGYPIVANVFYGDYPAALDILRGHDTAEIFNPNSSLYTGTPAEGSLDFMAEYLDRVTTLQLVAKPGLAGAYFIRGWALSLLDPKDRNALADLRRAADLEPSERLFTESVAYLTGQE